MIAQKENTQIEAMAFLIFLCFFSHDNLLWKVKTSILYVE